MRLFFQCPIHSALLKKDMFFNFILAFALPLFVVGQQVGTYKPEVHPTILIQSCRLSAQSQNATMFGTYASVGSTCMTETIPAVIDANWRWLHSTTGYNNCYDGTSWDTELCPDPSTCAKNCALEGADYSNTYGVNTYGSTMELGYVTGTNVGSRMYLMDSKDTYKLFKLKNREFTFDVDASQLPCGLNGAVYFIEMDADGGKSKYPTNAAGAEYGVGYCDAQCPKDIKFIEGEGNVLNGKDFSKGGTWGTCCAEMDIWEANSISSAYTAHTCDHAGGYKCVNDCTSPEVSGVCDQGGCDNNPYRAGNPTFYGPGSNFEVDSTKPVTVVTQWLTQDGTDNSDLKEIKRYFVQNGKVIENPTMKFSGAEQYSSLSDEACAVKSKTFEDPNDFAAKGGMSGFGAALDRGMVLALSLWDDNYANMLWLDSDFPLTEAHSKAGVSRGSCATTTGTPSEVRSQSGSAKVKYSNIKYGNIGTTFSG